MKKSYPPKCHLCQDSVANKKNSHIIPSFIMCRLSTADGTGKRNHELTYSVGNIIKAYTGNEVPMDVMERNFDDLSDERIEEELKKNDVALDDVFCPVCEKRLADYTESPYSNYFINGGRIDPKEQYFFWMSVLWRVSHFRLLKYSLPKYINAELRKSLICYLKNRDNKIGKDTPEKYPIFYRIVRCKDYVEDSGGLVYAHYDKPNRIYCISLGYLVVCFSFTPDQLPQKYDFFGLGDVLRSAAVNDGSANEIIKDVDKDIFDRMYESAISTLKSEYIDIEVKMIVKLWKSLLQFRCPLPSRQPSVVFIQQCLLNIHDEKVKLGEKHTHRNFAQSFAGALESVYGIKIPNN